MFSPDRAAALRRLQEFLPRAGLAYAKRRNFDPGPGRQDPVSRLSPWLRHRVLLETEVLREVCAAQGQDAARKFIDEVYWRAYFRGWMAQHAGAWSHYLAERDRAVAAVAGNATLHARVLAAEQGQTGNPAFDSWARELCSNGYLHNHARMWFASIWIFTLRLPWALGADFFLRHLLDGDPASNTLGWRWVGGLHTRGKTYLARRDNILRFTEGRLDPGAGLATEAVPLEESEPLTRTGISWPARPEDGKRNGWLMTPEDCRADTGPREPDAPLLGVLNAESEAGAPAVAAFSRGCVADALTRCGQGGAPLVAAEDSTAVRSWASEYELDAVHVMHVPYGPIADGLVALEAALAVDGVRLQRHVRQHDAECWPHAGRGFFQLRKRIPDLLQAVGAGDAQHA